MLIADAIDVKTRAVNDALWRAQREFELIREYRTRLIADLVTGKLDMREAAARGFSTATDLADWLVRELKLPFREAHEITGRIVARSEALGVRELGLLPLGEFQEVDARIPEAARALLSVEKSVESRDSYGGTAPQRVREQISRWMEMFK